MRAYYLNSSQFAISAIAFRRIKVSRFSDLNDPFELLAVDIGASVNRKPLRKVRDRVNETTGLLCFSRSWSNPLLWGHYADKHSGIALGFDLPDARVKAVIYAEAPTKLVLDFEREDFGISGSLLDKLLRTKFADWKYEDEVRMLIDLKDWNRESGLYFQGFDESLVLSEVILGPRCELPIESVRTLVAPLPPQAVTKSRIAFSSFRVVKDQNASRLPLEA
jgi:hypothetical protein